jgi:glycosyltransferase involved in cell wall biosynthesis
MPKITIIIPLLNKEPYINKTLQSVINQTYEDFEIIVVDGLSFDRSVDVVKSFDDSRIRVFTEKDQGTSDARNKGISRSRGDLIAFLDADDIWMPTFLETALRLYNRYPHAGVFSTNYTLRKPGGYFQRTKHKYLPKFPWEGILQNYFRAALSRSPVFIPSSAIIKKSVLEKVGSFCVGDRIEDLEMWARIALHYPIAWSSNVQVIFNREDPHSRLKIEKIHHDDKVIDTLKSSLSYISVDQEKDIRNLIGHYYKNCSLCYVKIGDSKNALRCINESIRYVSGHLVIKSIMVKVLLLLPRPIFTNIEHIQSSMHKYFYMTR